MVKDKAADGEVKGQDGLVNTGIIVVQIGT
jgi:hypothetical protein